MGVGIGVRPEVGVGVGVGEGVELWSTHNMRQENASQTRKVDMAENAVVGLQQP